MSTAEPQTSDLLRVRGLTIEAHRPDGSTIELVHDASFSIAPGEVSCLVGESGSGKTVTAASLFGLTRRKGLTARGEVMFAGTELLALSDAELRSRRGRDMAMVFQEPSTYLDPLATVRDQLREAIRRREKLTRSGEQERMEELLSTVGIHDISRVLRQYPHQMSGGMSQRVMLAIALAARPRLLIADEPTTAIDVTLQVQIIRLIDHLRRTTGMSVLLVTHDMGVAAEIADRVVIMYAGRVIEEGTPHDVFANPAHPYTAGLLASIPRVDRPPVKTLPAMPGMVPDPTRPPGGCAFHPRCPVALDRCRTESPSLDPYQNGNGSVSCWRADEIQQGELSPWMHLPTA